MSEELTEEGRGIGVLTPLDPPLAQAVIGSICGELVARAIRGSSTTTIAWIQGSQGGGRRGRGRNGATLVIGAGRDDCGADLPRAATPLREEAGGGEGRVVVAGAVEERRRGERWLRS